MKKENKKIIIVIGIISLCILSGYFVIKNNYNGSSNVADKSNIINEYEEINLGDDCSYCMTMCERGGGSNCKSACSYACASQSVTYCCCNTGRTICSNSSTCTGYGWETVAVNVSSSRCASYAVNAGSGGGNDDPEPPAPSDPPITYVNISAAQTYFTPSEASGNFGTASSGGGTPTSWSANGHFSVSGSGSSVNINFANPTKGTGTTPAANDVSVTASNSSGSKTSSTRTAYVYSCDWKKSSGSWKDDGTKEIYENHFVKPGCNFYSNRVTENGVSYFKTWHGRCCSTVSSEGTSSSGSRGGSSGGSSYEPVPPEEDFGHCYGDNPYRALAVNVHWEPGPISSKHGYVYKEITDISQCKPYDDAITCTSGVKNSSPKTTVANECEDNVSFDVTNSSKICSSGNASFYKIVCTTKVTTDFDMDDNIVKSNYTMYSGLGFKFNINVIEKTECTAEFNLKEWEKAYDKIMTKLKAVEHSSVGSAYSAYQKNNATAFNNYANNLVKNSNAPSSTVSRLIELYKKARNIEGLVDDYNGYKIKENSNPSTTLEVTYLDKGKNKNITAKYQFESELADCNPVKKVTKTHSDIKKSASWLTPPQNYTETYTRSVNLYPASVLINKATGEILDKNTTETNVLDGGNKVYISSSAAAQTIPLNITISGLARNNSKVVNNKCSLKLSERDLTYRPIDVTNPFIDSSWKKGENWVNTLYDFTKTIHANTWSEKSTYTIDLSASMISALKTSNAKNQNSDPYLGLCNRQKYELQDAVTRQLCSLLK